MSNKQVKMTKKEFLHFLDNEDEAFNKVEEYWYNGEKNVTVAKVSQMLNPPNTVHKYVVIRITEL